MPGSATPSPNASPELSSGLFRDKALTKLSSPDQLDQLVRIVPSLSWLSLGAILAIICVALLWGFFGSLPLTVNGQGILLRGGEISAVTSQGSGQVTALDVKVGDVIHVGDKIGSISQPVLLSRIASQRKVVEDLRKHLEEVRSESDSMLGSQLKFSADQRTSAQTSIHDYEQQREALKKVVSAQESLQVKGLIPVTTLLQSRTQLNTTELNILSAKNQLQQLESNDLNARSTSQDMIYRAESSLQTEVDTLGALEAQMNQTSAIISTMEGRVMGLSARVGDDVAPGTRILQVEDVTLPMAAVLYFPPGLGKKVRPGMIAQVSPETAPVQKYGFIVGNVRAVADFPATPGSLMDVLANQTMVNSISASGAPLELTATLKSDNTTVSRFKWSSSRGLPTAVSSGTLCTARVIYQEERPVDLVVPLLKEFFGVAD